MRQSEARVGQQVRWSDKVWTITGKPKSGKTVWLDNTFRVQTEKLTLVEVV